MLKFVPTAKQAEFLASDDDICGMMGGAGSGKSYIMLWDALGLNDTINGPRINLPYYRALLYRKQYKQLSELIDKSKQIYPLVDPGAVFTSTDLTWTFSSGAKIKLQYFENYSQVESLQGITYQYIGCDEIGTYENDKIFKYALSRLRSPEGLKCYFRATSNPSRYPWLMEYFRIKPDGKSTNFSIDYTLADGTVIKKTVRYIQALLKDNPHLSKEYEAQLMLLPEDERRALLDGDWLAYASIDGQIYEHELKKIDEEKRNCSVPYDPALDVYTFFDIGISDMCVILFVQYVGKEIHIIDKIEDNNKGLQEYIAILKKYELDKGYRYAKHLLPHDSNAREKFTGLTILEQFEKYYKNVEALPRLPIADGILKTKEMLANCWFDNKTDVVDKLRHYRRDWNERLQVWGDPRHDNYSHLADAIRYVSYYEKPTNKSSWASYKPNYRKSAY